MGSSIRLDRISTWDEVCYAISFSSDGAFELGCTCDAACEMEPDFSDRVPILAEEFAWLMLASEMADSNWN